jgi:phage baseplate assembly protein W
MIKINKNLDLICATKLLFENETEFLYDDIRSEVAMAIAQFEPRASVSEINIVRDDSTNIVYVDVSYYYNGKEKSVRTQF